MAIKKERNKMTPQERKVMEQALEELENCADLLKMFEAPIDSCVGGAMLGAEKAANAIKEALAVDKESLTTEAQPEQEPVECDCNQGQSCHVCDPYFPFDSAPQTTRLTQKTTTNDVAIGVDVTEDGTHVTAMRMRTDGINIVIYSQFHPLAQPEQEPVAKRLDTDDAWNFAGHVWSEMDRKSMPGIYMQMVTEAIVKHYTHPQNPQRSEDINLSCKSTQARLATSWGYVKAQPLTDEEIEAIVLTSCVGEHGIGNTVARAIEKAHGIGCETTLVKE